MVGLSVSVATAGPILAWQADCITALAAVPGLSIDGWVRLPCERASSASGSGPLAPVATPSALDHLGDPSAESAADPSTDVIVDLTQGALSYPVAGESDVWYFGYGPSRLRDAMRSSLIDRLRTPGRSYVALLAEPGSAGHPGGLAFLVAR